MKGKKCFNIHSNLEIKPQGYLNICCYFNDYEFTKKLHISDPNVFKKFENLKIKIKRDLENNIWPSGCKKCKDFENKGLRSKRITDMNLFPVFGKKQYITLQIWMGNICNFKCEMCSGMYSSGVHRDELKNGLTNQVNYDKLKRESEWANDIESFKRIPIENARTIILAGGEPLLNKTHFKWLDTIPNKEKITIEYVTNGSTYISEENIKILRKFEKIKFLFSIDGRKEIHEKIRKGSDFDKIINNVKRYNYEFKGVFFNFTLQKHNIIHLFDFLFFLCANIPGLSMKNVDEFFYLNILVTPKKFNYLSVEENEAIKIVQVLEKRTKGLPKSELKRQLLLIKDEYIDVFKLKGKL